MKNQSITPEIHNPPIEYEILKRLSNDKSPIIGESIDETWKSTRNVNDIINDYNEMCSQDFNSDMDYRLEYSNLLKNHRKQCHWMRFVGKDSHKLQWMLHASENKRGGVSTTDIRTKYSDYRLTNKEMDKNLIILMRYWMNNKIRPNYRPSDMNMLKHSELLSELNLKEKELIQLKRELLRVGHYQKMKSLRQQQVKEMVQCDRIRFRGERDQCRLNGNFGCKECRKHMPWKQSKHISNSKLVKPSVVKRVRHCRHFLKGHCDRGKGCGFIHDRSIFCSDRQKVFLGGVPRWFSPSILRQKLSALGYTVLNIPRILPGFSPEVCLGSDDEAQKLIETGNIILDGVCVSVRPFKYQNPDIGIRCSVFLGGLATGTTAAMIKEELAKLDAIVVNHPVVKSGFSPQVKLRSSEEKQKLVQIGRVRIHGVIVYIRPYADIRK